MIGLDFDKQTIWAGEWEASGLVMDDRIGVRDLIFSFDAGN